MKNTLLKEFFLIIEDAHFGRSGTRIDYQKPVSILIFRHNDFLLYLIAPVLTEININPIQRKSIRFAPAWRRILIRDF
jgi:hypothetical protein